MYKYFLDLKMLAVASFVYSSIKVLLSVILLTMRIVYKYFLDLRMLAVASFVLRITIVYSH